MRGRGCEFRARHGNAVGKAKPCPYAQLAKSDEALPKTGEIS
jgi:hypothetical protein